MPRSAVLFLAFIAFALGGIAHAGQVAAIFDDTKPGTYLVTVAANGQVSAVPIKVVRPKATPTPNPVPNPPPTGQPSAYEQEVARLTKAALDAGGTQTTGAALSSVYSLIADEVASGNVAVDKWPQAVKSASDLVLGLQADSAKWAPFRDSLGKALTALQGQGHLATKSQVASVLKETAKGMNTATGFQGSPAMLVNLTPENRMVRPDAILEGLDLARIIELVRLIMDLMKLFEA